MEVSSHRTPAKITNTKAKTKSRSATSYQIEIKKKSDSDKNMSIYIKDILTYVLANGVPERTFILMNFVERIVWCTRDDGIFTMIPLDYLSLKI